MNAIHIFRPEDEIPLETARAIIKLTRQVWPPDEDAPPPDVEKTLARWKQSAAFVIVLQEENTIIAHAQIFRRDIKTTQGILPLGALAGVCVHPERRGHGYGAEVVRRAFQVLSELGVEVSLYQTDVPEFYEKLGARVVTNSFFDGTRADGTRENPFWGACEMIYPASFNWPDGEIDINGPGY